MSGAAEVEIPRLEAGEDVDVGEATVVEDLKSDPQPDHQAQEPDPEYFQEQVKQTQMIVK